jgi:hypothetical protein
MPGVQPPLSLPRLKKKMLSVMSNFPSIRAPFYVPQEVMHEGAAVKRHATIANGIVNSGANDGAATIGLAMQEVYDNSAAALGTQFSQLAEYHFNNDTAQPLNGQPIGVLMGQGYAEIRNYVGTFAPESPVYVGPSGLLVTTGHAMAVANNLLPIVCEGDGKNGSGTNGDRPVRIRFNFKMV